MAILMCTACGERKDETDFYAKASARTGRRSECKRCTLDVNKRRVDRDRVGYNAERRERYRTDPEWKAAHQASRRRSALRKKYGLTVEDYEALLAAQEGVCAICDQPERLPRVRLAVDHDHDTGAIRGLLCFDCNTSLGKIEAYLGRVSEYLRAAS